MVQIFYSEKKRKAKKKCHCERNYAVTTKVEESFYMVDPQKVLTPAFSCGVTAHGKKKKIE